MLPFGWNWDMFCTQRTGQEAPHGAPQPLVDYFNRELAMDDGDNNAADMGFQWKKKYALGRWEHP
jgi:hypothetical protein